MRGVPSAHMQRLFTWSLLCCSCSHALHATGVHYRCAHATGVHRRLPTMSKRMRAFMGAAEEAAPGDGRESSLDGESSARPPTAPPPAPRTPPPPPLASPPPPPPAAPGAFHPGIVCAVQKQIIVGYRYDRPASAADQAAARAAGYNAMDTYSICQVRTLSLTLTRWTPTPSARSEP